MKKISKEGIDKLLNAGLIKNTGKGYVGYLRKVDGHYPVIGYYRTANGHHRYIEDAYADAASKM